jgi:hypothetical protein
VLSGLTLGLTIWLLGASLPDLDGEFRVSGLRASAVIERDDLGVPTLTASNRLDVIFSLCFVHGQDRFFQMDLSRRRAAPFGIWSRHRSGQQWVGGRRFGFFNGDRPGWRVTCIWRTRSRLRVTGFA